MREGNLTESPVARVESAARTERKLPRTLTVEELAQLLAAPDTATPIGRRDAAFLELLYASGLRVSEAANLTCGALDLARGRVRVMGKGGRERMVPVGEPARLALKAHLGNRVEVVVRPVESPTPAPPAAGLAPAQSAKPNEPAPERFTVTEIKPAIGRCS